MMSDDWREITADWAGDMTFIGRNAAGGTVQMGTVDGKPGVGPMELVLVAIAGCTAMDIVNILEKKRQNLDDLTVTVRGKRADSHPKIYTEIEVVYHVSGSVQINALEDAIRLSEEKYCSVSAMLRGTTTVTSRYELRTPEGQEFSASV